MTYSTELPEGFKTWNELWNSLTKGREITEKAIVFRVENPRVFPVDPNETPHIDLPLSLTVCFETNYIKAKCYDEIMEEKRIYTEQQVREAFIEGMKFIAVHPDYYEKDADEYMQTINPH